MAATDRFGQMQYIWCLRSPSEYTVPTVRAAGSDGGTIVVDIESSQDCLTNIVLFATIQKVLWCVGGVKLTHWSILQQYHVYI